MTTHLEDYVELLNAEQHVQVDKLREHARHGVSSRVRGEVWLYLLSVLSPDKTSEISSIIHLNATYQSITPYLPRDISGIVVKEALICHMKRFGGPDYAGLISSLTAETDLGRDTASKEKDMAPMKSKVATIGQGTNQVMNDPSHSDPDPSLTLRTQYSRFLPPPPNAPLTRSAYLSVLEEVLGKYYTWRESQYGVEGYEGGIRSGTDGDTGERDWVWLITPFTCCLTRPAAIFLGFQKLMERLDAFPPLPSRLASLLTLFRMALPELFEYFEDEQVEYVKVACSWVTGLLAREMWLINVLRLWDAYLASDGMFELHCYVCVAILATCKETLEELDGSEARLFLLDLPPMDVDRLLQDAANLRVSHPLPRPIADQG